MTTNSIRVLLIDDEESDYLMTRSLLGQIERPQMEVDWASAFDDGLDRLIEDRHDLCLLDYFLGDETGLDLLRAARSRGVRTPIILLTGKGSREVDLEAMRAGAVDYLQKGTEDPELMERAIRYAVERHRAQEELRRSEERHRGMFDHLPLGLFRVSAEGEYMEANPALIRTLEYPDRSTLRQAAHNYFVSPRDRERFFRTLTDQGMVMGFESELRTASDRIIQVRNTARVHRGPAAQIEYVEGTVEDVTGRVVSRKLEEEAGAFRVLRDTSDGGMLLADPDGRVRSVGASLLKALGRQESLVVGEAVWDLFHPEDGAEIARGVEKVTFGDQHRLQKEARLTSASGETLRRQATLSAIPRPGGGLLGVLILLEDLEAAQDG